MDNKLLHKFNRSLLRAATSADALIISNGLWKGVTRLIGDAAATARSNSTAGMKRVRLLGIASWGVLQETECLINSGGPHRYPVYDHMENEKVPASLDPNHHFQLLIDNGSNRQYGTEVAYRAELEDAILQHLACPSQPPAVLLVMEGGETTLTTTMEFLRKDRPVVVVEGLGGAGDLIAFAYRQSEGMSSNDSKQFEHIVYSDETNPHWKRYLHFKKNQDVEQTKRKATSELFEACVQRRRLISTVHLDHEAEKLDSVVLEATFKASTADPFNLLGLAVQWNCADIANRYVFTGHNCADPAFYKTLNDKSDLFATALKRNYVESVQTLISHGFRIDTFLTPNLLNDMYSSLLRVDGNDASFVDAGLLYILRTTLRLEVVDGADLPGAWLLDLVGDVIAEMAGHRFPNIYQALSYAPDQSLIKFKMSDGTATYELIRRVVAVARIDSSKRTVENPSSDAQTDGNLVTRRSRHGGTVDNAAYSQRDVFIFAIIFNRRELAFMLWSQLDRGGQLAAAIFACAILSRLTERSRPLLELADALTDHANYWEQKAIDLIEFCFEQDRQRAQFLLTKAVPEFGNKTPMELAHAAQRIAFMGTACCSTKLNKIWLGAMSPTSTPTWLVISAFLCPLLVFAIKFRIATEQTTGKRNQAVPFPNEIESTELQLQPTPPVPLQYKHKNVSRWSDIPIAFASFYSAPITKFLAHVLSHAVFAIMFSVLTLTQLSGNLEVASSIGRLEILVWIWSVSTIIEDVRQAVAFGSSNHVQMFLHEWLLEENHKLSNLGHLLSFSLVVAGAICHLVQVVNFGVEDDAWTKLGTAALSCYCIALSIYFIRTLSFFYVSESLGPTVIAIKRMMFDLAFIALIYIILLLTFCVPVQSLLYPQTQISAELLSQIFYFNYMTLFQMFSREPETRGILDGCNAASNDSMLVEQPLDQRCPQLSYLASIFYAIYLVLVLIMLINLLIAMFAHTFDRVYERSAAIWRFTMFDFVRVYYRSSWLAPPLSLLGLAYILIQRLVLLIAAKVRQKQRAEEDEDSSSISRMLDSAFVHYESSDTPDGSDSTVQQRKSMERFDGDDYYPRGVDQLKRFEVNAVNSFLALAKS